MSEPLGFTSSASGALPLDLVGRVDFAAWRDALPPASAAWVQTQGFDGAPGTVVLVPGPDGELLGAAIGIGDPLDPYSYGHAPFALPARSWRAPTGLGPGVRDALRLGWGLGSYRFDRYKAPPRAPAQLLAEGFDDEVFAVLAASVRVRDLVNTPTEHMGPDELEQIAREIAERHGARIEVIAGDELLARNFPAIHAVGRASHRAPRLIALDWGDAAHPHVAVVGKGVCFDTGGLDLKPADGMRWMKKDMGGAAHAIALAELIMARKLPLRITLLVPAVENAVGPNAFRPGEVIATRQGTSVEIDNTDAEGRVVLCDALAYAGERKPALLLDFATLTGAARIALGPDLPALYSNQDALAQDWLDAGTAQRDPVWRMPLWRPYLRYLTSHIADIANGGPSKMAGSVTAALYLERFVPADLAWAHLDVYSWNDADRPGRPAGGEAQGLRAVFAMLKARAAG
ncbi:cytosol aminopeptidase family, catalytic domain [Lysobacter enzymogenes]|uniref:Cytosol aminopeptidase family, catalytic domain n=1 Tax=Lysobacter enzymogenes TaxID=69 RepID=A0A0S2DME1_LYSEN|nr:leucyl aminopeptidase family protein [Lysobacter enzymogenes]ALN59799.1 cytosol aminopeptidase family, catalytic domain [Lysobacter enzymogenes]